MTDIAGVLPIGAERKYVGGAMSLDVAAIFESELARRGVAFEREDELVYRVHVDGIILRVNVENVRRNAERDEDPGVVTRFVDHVLDFSCRQPTWAEARSLLFWAAEATSVEVGETIRVDVSKEVTRVLTLTDSEWSKVTMVTPAMCERWGITVEEACSAASNNQDRLLDGVELEIGRGNERLERLGMIPVDHPYKASTIFAAAFKRFVQPALGWPVLVVLPCRDFVYVIAEGSPLLGRLGSVVVREFQNSGYPLTTEVFRVSDEGVEAIGRFPV